MRYSGFLCNVALAGSALDSSLAGGIGLPVGATDGLNKGDPDG